MEQEKKCKKSWFSKLLDPDGTVSSKRFITLSLLIWVVISGSYYIVAIQFETGKESTTTVDLLKTALLSAIGLGVGGTAAEGFKKLRNEK